MKTPSQRIYLIGGNNKAKLLARSLTERGYTVAAINASAEICEELALIPHLRVYNGDGSLPNVLDDASIHDADIAIALTGKDEDNLVICQLCKKRFGVKRTVALISDPRKTEFFYKLGIDSVVCEVTSVASIIEQQTLMNEFSTLVPIGDGRIKISQVPIPADAPSVNKRVMDIKLPNHVIIGCIVRGEDGMIPRGNTVIHAGDVLVLISSDEQESSVRELTGRESEM
ncbi:MAG: NAD-binding protein [Oscillospiraceae bacterium]|jgi:trk system potassium uptake protein TrkA|nr:NAD-binding protein [Oscillospiraceae bacterium]